MVLVPVLQLLLSLLVVAVFATGPSVALMAAIWLGPVPVVVALAVFDARTLRRRGVSHPTSGWWALLGAPIFLAARAVRLSRISARGYGPIGVAVLIGGAMVVNCPPSPPLFIGQQLRCPATDAKGDPVVITVSLQRSNGWIAWQVDDWGVFSLRR